MNIVYIHTRHGLRTHDGYIPNSLRPQFKSQDIKAYFFVEIMVINGKYGQVTHSIKMGAASLAENTPNASKFICPICLPKLKSPGFQ